MRLTHVRVLARGALLLCAVELASQTPGFEVVSIRPSAAGASTGTSVDLFEGGRIRIANEPVKLLLRMAFQVDGGSGRNR